MHDKVAEMLRAHAPSGCLFVQLPGSGGVIPINLLFFEWLWRLLIERAVQVYMGVLVAFCNAGVGSGRLAMTHLPQMPYMAPFTPIASIDLCMAGVAS